MGRPGGFGQVFAGTDGNQRRLAIKRLHLDATAVGHRELDIADALIGRAVHHVVPVLDAGIDADSGRIYVVMERADRSLRDELNARGRLPEPEAVAIVEAIASGLAELGEVVHRDLKPDNVLAHDGAWKVADFGIARFVEEATSTNTLKGNLTPAYAAPEQWRSERATHATDIYALGCTAHELLTGAPPFSGATADELMRKHLEEAPPESSASPPVRLLVQTCLRKPPLARPTISGLLARLRTVSAEQQRGADVIQAAAAVVEAADARRDAERLGQERARREREELAGAGCEGLVAIVAELFSRIASASQGKARVAPMAPGRQGRLEGRVGMGRGALSCWVAFPVIAHTSFANSRMNIAAGAVIHVGQDGHPHYDGRGANLWYGDLDASGAFAWWEQAYMTNAWIPGRRRAEPFGVEDWDGLRQADQAHSMMAELQRASRLRRIEGQGLEEFCERWMDRLARAATCSLSMPSSMPDESVN